MPQLTRSMPLACDDSRWKNRCYDLTSTLIFSSEVLIGGVRVGRKGFTSRPLATVVWRTLSQIFVEGDG